MQACVDLIDEQYTILALSYGDSDNQESPNSITHTSDRYGSIDAREFDPEASTIITVATVIVGAYWRCGNTLDQGFEQTKGLQNAIFV